MEYPTKPGSDSSSSCSGCNRLQCSDFGCSAEDPAVFAKQCCGGSRYGYLIYRVIFACYLVGSEAFIIYKLSATFVFDLFIYLSEWMSLALMCYSILAVFGAICNKPGPGAEPAYTTFKESGHIKYGAPPKPPRGSRLKQSTPVAFKVAWILFNICLSVCPFVTVIYWLLVRNPEWYDTTNATSYAISYAIDIHTHAFITFLVYLDLFVSGTPIRMAHMIYGVIFALFYVAFTAVYWYIGGSTPEGRTSIYHIIDWENPLQTGYYVIGALAVLCVFHILGYLMHRLRIGCFSCFCIPKARAHRCSHRYVELDAAAGQEGENFGLAPLARAESCDL